MQSSQLHHFSLFCYTIEAHIFPSEGTRSSWPWSIQEGTARDHTSGDWFLPPRADFCFIFLTFSSCYTPLCSCFWQQRRLLLLSSPVCFTDVSTPDSAAIASPRSTHTPAPLWLQDQLCSTMQPCWLLSGHADMVGLKTRELWVHFNSFSHVPNSQLLGPEKEMMSWKSRCKSSNCSSGCSKSRGCAMDESSAPSRQNKSYHAAKEKWASIGCTHLKSFANKSLTSQEYHVFVTQPAGCQSKWV